MGLGLPVSCCLQGAFSGLSPWSCPAPLCPAEVSASPLATMRPHYPHRLVPSGCRVAVPISAFTSKARPAWPTCLAKLPHHPSASCDPALRASLGPLQSPALVSAAPGTNCLSLSNRSAAQCPQETPAQHLRRGREAGFHAQRGTEEGGFTMSRQGDLQGDATPPAEGRGTVLRRQPPTTVLSAGPGRAVASTPSALCQSPRLSADSGALHPAPPHCPQHSPGRESAPQRSQRLPCGRSLTPPCPRSGGLWGV